MSNDEAQLDASGNYTPKERLELERWAKLHGMSLADYLQSDIHPNLEAYRQRREENAKGADRQIKGA